MVKVENPGKGPTHIRLGAAEALIASGRAMAVVRVNGVTHMIRLTGPVANDPRTAAFLTARGYDGVDRSFYEDARNLPLIAPEKMIREERSTQDWSFSRAVWHRRGSVKVNHGR